MYIRDINRRGLSTLEMVLVLPILLFMMALTINFGTAACWKIRSSIMARQTLWDSRSERSGSTDLRPAYWPTSGTTANSTDAVPELDDPRVNQPLVRGPLPGAIVNDELFDPSHGLHTASANLTRSHTLLKKMGKYHVASQSDLLDGLWTYAQMGLLCDNWEWRIPVLYKLSKADHSLVTAYFNAAIGILSASFRPALQPLDKDDEFISYGEIFGWDNKPPDFHPALNKFCSLDGQLADERVAELLDRIQGKKGETGSRVPDVAEQMTKAFIDLYKRVIDGIQHPESARPPLTDEQVAALKPRVKDLEEKIEQLQKFLDSLTNE